MYIHVLACNGGDRCGEVIPALPKISPIAHWYRDAQSVCIMVSFRQDYRDFHSGVQSKTARLFAVVIQYSTKALQT